MMSQSKTRVCLLFLVVAQAGRGLGQNNELSADKVDKLQTFVEGLKGCRKFVGMSLALVKVGLRHFYQMSDECMCISCGTCLRAQSVTLLCVYTIPILNKVLKASFYTTVTLYLCNLTV